MSLTLYPVTLAIAKSFTGEFHRHHGPASGHKFSIGVKDADGKLRGIVCVGRPVNNHLDTGLTAEVTRLCTDGYPNACSMLYSAAWRASKAMGYTRIVTYILESESGISLRAAGWLLVNPSCGGMPWNCKNRKRADSHPLVKKQRWEIAR